MTLHRELFRELVEILTQYYGFENEARRRATLLSAGLRDLIKQLDLSGETAAFIPLLLERLDSYGVDDDGVPALAHLLQYIASQVGNPNRTALQRICQQIAPPRSPNRTERTPDALLSENGAAPPIWDVFICYAREDLSTAKRLYDDLERAGVAVWLDKKKLVVGQNWKFEVKKAMQRSRYILTLLSSHSVSKSGYVQKELLEALEMLAHLPPDRILIIPVRLDDCEPTHEQLRDLHWLDLFESYDEGLQQILQLFPSSSAINQTSVGARSPRPTSDMATLEKKAETVKTEVQRRETGAETAPLRNITVDLAEGVTLELIAIPGGTFWMGSPDGVGEKNEHPRHQVTVAPFYMGKYPVTQAQWQAVMGANPSRFEGDDRPVEWVSWYDTQVFLKELDRIVETPQWGTFTFRLPSEAEWEYACRAGTQSVYSFGDDPKRLDDYAWYGGNSGNETHPVGQKLPNDFGLYDMHGNICEWCTDDWHENYKNAPNDGSEWIKGANKDQCVLRGGNYNKSSKNLRCAFRMSYNWRLSWAVGYGFRLVCSGLPSVSPF